MSTQDAPLDAHRHVLDAHRHAVAPADVGPVDVAVVGAGTIGLSTAWRCAEAGLSVALVDPQPARGASWAAAGMLAPVTEVHYGEEPLLALNLDSNARWPDFAAALTAATDLDIGYRPSGTVVVARDTDDNAVLTDLHAFQASLGLEVTRLTGREARRLEPGLAPRTRGGILVAGDHQVDNRALVGALLVACRRAGVRLVTAPATALVGHDDRVTGVHCGEDVIAAGAVLLAAGAGSAMLDGLPPGALPIRPVKGQLLHLRRPADHPPEPIAQRTIRGLDVYLVPRADGRLVVGATVEERGDDRTVTAGGVLELLQAAWELLPGIAEYALVETIAGLRPGTPDNAPLLGWTPLDGLAVATGHYRNGVLLTPVTAAAMAALLAGEPTPELLAPFDPRRFADAPDTTAPREVPA